VESPVRTGRFDRARPELERRLAPNPPNTEGVRRWVDKNAR